MRLQYAFQDVPAPTKHDTAVFLFEEDEADLKTRPELAGWKTVLTPLLRAGEFKGEYLAELPLRLSAKEGPSWLFLVGLGSKANVTPARALEAAAKAAGLAQARKAKNLCLVLPPPAPLQPDQALEQMALGVKLGLYQQRVHKSKPPESRDFREVCFLGSRESGPADRAKETLAGAEITAKAVCLARDLANQPGNLCYPETLAAKAVELARELKLKVTVWDEKEAAAEGAGAFLAVGQGSAHPPRLVIMHYHGAKKAPPLALVGKGVTFDSGGLCLKPAAGMEAMKTDMSGAANALAVTCAVAEMKLPLNLVTIMPLVENMPGGGAYRPGDVLKSLSGRTVEVINTDAEGRLILADALTLAQRCQPAQIIDLATLTGACVVALGQHCAGLFTNQDDLRRRLLEAAGTVGENIWPLPLLDEYEEDLKSETADFAHIATQTGGAVNAALFLRKFVDKNIPWAHIDIAGPSRALKARPSTPVGGTGFGVRTVLKFLETGRF